MAEIFLGVVADDFTGASDAASMLSEAGLPTVLFNSVPDSMTALREDIRAAVVAEKTRTIPAEEAKERMLRAFDWLRYIGAKQLYFKYCATFDSTERGNIGPVADAVLEKYKIPYTILAPALPVNGRTVRGGRLFVNGIPLGESHMRNHPLTPMRESDLTKLFEMQSKNKAYRLSIEEMKDWLSGRAHPSSSWKEREQEGEKYYLVPDYYEEGHGDLIAGCFGDLPFLTGGSGLCAALGRRLRMFQPGLEAVRTEECGTAGKALLLAGSCSAITLKQIEDYRAKGKPTYFMDPAGLLQGTLGIKEILDWIKTAGKDPLVYSSQGAEERKRTETLGLERAADCIEKSMGELAKEAVKLGFSRIISAGGETSGAVTKALGYQAFYIGKSVAPGVPIMTPTENPRLRLILKSGGFGQTDFFQRAVEMSEA